MRAQRYTSASLYVLAGRAARVCGNYGRQHHPPRNGHSSTLLTAAISLATLLGSLVMGLPYIWERSVLHCAHDVATSQTELQTAQQPLHAQDALARSVPSLKGVKSL